MTTQERLLSLTPLEESNWPMSLWRASSLGNCLRLQLLEARGIRLGLTPDIARKYATRSAIHVEMQKWIVKEFAVVKTQPRPDDDQMYCINPTYPPAEVRLEHEYIDNEHKVSGHPDAIILTTDPATVVEIKTCASGPFKGYLSGRAHPYWGYQTDFYARQAEEEFGRADIVSLLVDVESAALAIIETPRNDYTQVCDELTFWWEAGELPPVDESRCEKCPLGAACHSASTLDELVKGLQR